MLINFLRVAIRNLQRNRGYASINIAGLAIGMAVVILIGMWMFDELSFNKNHKNYDRIAQVYMNQTVNDQVTTRAECPMPTHQELKTTYGNYFKHVVTAWWENNHLLQVGEKKLMQNGTFIEPAALEMFSYNIKLGSLASLQDQSSIVLSEPAAKALFGDKNPLNQTIRIDNNIDVKVTGVFEQMPYNSRFHDIQFLASWDMWVARNAWLEADTHNWSKTVSTFVELKPGLSLDEVNQAIGDLKKKNISEEQAGAEKPELFLEPMSRWHLYSVFKDGKSIGGRIQFVWLFGIIGAFVLFLACINFMNLSTAQSEKRAKEVGIRKSIGSMRSQLIQQFLSESFAVVVCAYCIALTLVTALLPVFNELTDKRMTWPWDNLYFWGASLIFILFTSFISGSYPALYLSSFQPVKVLKGTFRTSRFSATPRKVLVIVQFTVSIALIIGTVVIWQQVQYAKNRPVGYTRDGLIMVRKTLDEFFSNNNSETLRNELMRSSAVEGMAESSNPATEVWFNSSSLAWRGKDPNVQADFVTMAVTHDFGKTIGWKFVQGRDFSREHSTDSTAVVLNETAARLMNFENPLDEEIVWDGKKRKVIGVIKDMVMTSPYDPVKPTAYKLSYEEAYMITIRVNPAMSMSEALSKIEKVFQAVIPSAMFDYKFVDEEYARKFASEERVGKLASTFAVLAIFISCMGLFGMASFVAEQRRKEIGIRKILGASVGNLWTMLSVEFVQTVLIACVIGIPVAWLYLDEWLQQFTYRVSVSVWVIILSAACALIITIITVSFQTIRASMGNPVHSLRSE
ncbi:ABC transporter permease [Chryseosolibacter indicus]|uniref:ABC transporter permease n=1 Tax=Chryseosolibacter indicus TaxID=2782351 RepID=A0ABS5VP16_9BACT|nr:ABC transporter permease [Chryseosolibacter indicus]MBT1702758.1 ABC transporter permease [Chryseosolibacter indicus]